MGIDEAHQIHGDRGEDDAGAPGQRWARGPVRDTGEHHQRPTVLDLHGQEREIRQDRGQGLVRVDGGHGAHAGHRDQVRTDHHQPVDPPTRRTEPEIDGRPLDGDAAHVLLEAQVSQGAAVLVRGEQEVCRRHAEQGRVARHEGQGSVGGPVRLPFGARCPQHPGSAQLLVPADEPVATFDVRQTCQPVGRCAQARLHTGVVGLQPCRRPHRVAQATRLHRQCGPREGQSRQGQGNGAADRHGRGLVTGSSCPVHRSSRAASAWGGGRPF